MIGLMLTVLLFVLRYMILSFLVKKPQIARSHRVVFTSVCCLDLKLSSGTVTKEDEEIEMCECYSFVDINFLSRIQ